MNNKILLHTCCAVCCTQPIAKLKELGYDPVLFFYNPNIHPQVEYDIRLNELVKYCRKKKYELILREDDPDVWFSAVKGLENEPERGKRCLKCFELRLTETAKRAASDGYPAFTTTLCVSPHKVFADIEKIGNRAAEKFGIKFVAIDFKKHDGYLKAMKTAKEEGFYRQSYCGCIYSKR